jgi:hypothetical protein
MESEVTRGLFQTFNGTQYYAAAQKKQLRDAIVLCIFFFLSQKYKRLQIACRVRIRLMNSTSPMYPYTLNLKQDLAANKE